MCWRKMKMQFIFGIILFVLTFFIMKYAYSSFKQNKTVSYVITGLVGYVVGITGIFSILNGLSADNASQGILAVLLVVSGICFAIKYFQSRKNYSDKQDTMMIISFVVCLVIGCIGMFRVFG